MPFHCRFESHRPFFVQRRFDGVVVSCPEPVIDNPCRDLFYRTFVRVASLLTVAVALMAHMTLEATSRMTNATAKPVPNIFLIMTFSFPCRTMDWLDRDRLKKFKRFCTLFILFDLEYRDV